MDTNPQTFDVIVVGAGWAGLSVSYMLSQAGFKHVVYERDRISETWRSQRWASFRMNTPNVMTVLPGDQYQGPSPEGYMTRDDFVDMTVNYAARHNLPVIEGVAVRDVQRTRDGFAITTSGAPVLAKTVVVASGNLNVPRRPDISKMLPGSVNQMDGSDYKDAESLPPGAVLVVGCGNSGGQIAEDIALAGKRVFLSTGRNGRVPRRYRGRDILLWLTDTGRMAKPRDSAAGRGLVGATHTISLQSLSALGITIVGRLNGSTGMGTLEFRDTLTDSAEFGDQMSELLRREIDDHINREGIDAPAAVPDPAETVAPNFPDPPVLEVDLSTEGITSVIWSTGFRGDFSWLNVDGAVDASGAPVQDKNISVPGIYFIGLDTLESLRAGTVLAASYEARRIVDHISLNSENSGIRAF